jgi:hypothetical protein
MSVPSYREWLDWVFAGPEPDLDQLWDSVLDRSVDWQLDHATKLFEDPAFLLYAYPEDAVRKGLWRLTSSWEIRDLIWDQEVAWGRRKACIEAMYSLYTDLFSKNDYDGTCYMWWDLLHEFGAAPDARVTEAQLVVLDKILDLPGEDCQLDASHGLGHLDTPNKIPIIERYLSRSTLSEDVRAYAFAALDGRVL